MRDLGKVIVAKGFKKLPKEKKIAQSGHTANELGMCSTEDNCLSKCTCPNGFDFFQCNPLCPINSFLSAYQSAVHLVSAGCMLPTL